MGTPAGAWRFISGQSGCPMCELGWKSVGVLELTALPSIGQQRWEPWARGADVLLVEAAMPCIWLTGCVSRDLRPCCRRWIEPSGWD